MSLHHLWLMLVIGLPVGCLALVARRGGLNADGANLVRPPAGGSNPPAVTCPGPAG